MADSRAGPALPGRAPVSIEFSSGLDRFSRNGRITDVDLKGIANERFDHYRLDQRH
jgi:hypothetical protein